MGDAFPIDSIASEAQRFVGPDAPLQNRMMAAKGLVPLPPEQLVQALAALCYDAETRIQTGARGSLEALPSAVRASVLKTALPSAVLGVLAEVFAEDRSAIELVVMNRRTPDRAVVGLIETARDAVLIEIVGTDHERLLRCPELVATILRHPFTPPAIASAIAELASRGGMDVVAMLQTAEPESAAPVAQPMVLPSEMELIPEGDELQGEPDNLLEADAADAVSLDEVRAQTPIAPPTAEALLPTEGEAEMVDDESDAEEEAFPEFLVEEGSGELDEEERRSLLSQVQAMGVSEKVKLAHKGNKEARTLLLRDTNRVVCTAAIRSPKITDPEVVSAANNKTIHEDVIRIISQNRDWMKLYPVKAALTKNPKTPLGVAVRLVNSLNARDLRELARSKNVPSAVSAAARRIVANRERR